MSVDGSLRAAGVRIGWVDLPDHVRRAVEAILGGRVVEAVSQVGGFSPGTADRVRTAEGLRAFVKAVSPALNEHSPVLHRAEARITAALPASAPVPRLLGHYDDGEWIVLVLQDIEGRQPATPWLADDLRRVLAVLDDLAALCTPAPVADLPDAAAMLAEDLTCWWRVAADPPAGLDPWVAEHLDELCVRGDRGLAALVGDTLVHADVRADNVLLGPDGAVTLIDWPMACRGPAWLDSLMLLMNVRLYGGHDTHALLVERSATTGAAMADLLDVLVSFAGFFTHNARLPAPPGLPTLRRFQQAHADVLVSWLREEFSPR